MSDSCYVEGQHVFFRGVDACVLKIDGSGTNVRLSLPEGPPLWCRVSELRAGDTIDKELSNIRFILRSKDPEQVQAWRSVLHDENSEAFLGLDKHEIEQQRLAFIVEQGDIFVGAGTGEGCCNDVEAIARNSTNDELQADSVVSPANSFGDMTGGIDAVYLRRFGTELQRRLQKRIKDEFDGELVVGSALIVETPNNDPIRNLISAPTMRVPSSVAGTCNAYLAFRAVLIAVRQHNRAALVQCDDTLSLKKTISVILCPSLGTGIGLLPHRTCAYQMAMAYRQQVLSRHGCFESATIDHSELVKSR